MLDRARATGTYDALEQADIAGWRPDVPLALIFSNAALNWVPEHAAVLPRLAGCLAPGGVLAVQMPNQAEEPSHAAWREVAAAKLPAARIAELCLPALLPPSRYLDLLAAIGSVDLWETTYFQALPAQADTHPVRAFTEATYARRLLTAADRPEGLREAYEARMKAAYPVRDGHVVFPFRRLFFTLTVPA